MCFFDQHRFSCGDWKWGHFRHHCAKEYRMGETCGLKLVMETIPTATKCKLCDKIDTKMRRRAAEVDRIRRWQLGGTRFITSIDNATDLVKGLDHEIDGLEQERKQCQGSGDGLSPESDPVEKAECVPTTARAAIAERDEDNDSFCQWSRLEEDFGSENGLGDDCTALQSHPLPSDSGYRSGTGANTASVCSSDSGSCSMTLPSDLAQEFISSVVQTIIRTSGADIWAGFAVAHFTRDEFEQNVKALIKKHLGITISLPSTSEAQYLRGQNIDAKVLARLLRLLRHYRKQITSSICEEVFSDSINHSSLERILKSSTQLSLTERLDLLERTDPHERIPRNETSASKTNDDFAEAEYADQLFDDLEKCSNEFSSSGLVHSFAKELRDKFYRAETAENDGVETILREQSLYEPRFHSYEAYINVQWSPIEFMQSVGGKDYSNLGSVVVITGSTLYAQATTIAEYVAATWPRSGKSFLRFLDRVLDLNNNERLETKTSQISLSRDGLSIRANVFESRLAIFASATTDAQLIQLSQQLAWIGCALRSSPYGEEVAYLRPLFLRTSSRSFEIMFKHAPIHDAERACWLPLFPCGVIASGFPIAPREDETGLEISLPLLAAIAGVRRAVEYAGGVVMKSFSHLFVPIRKRGERLQWHAVINDDEDKRMTYAEGLSRCSSRAMLHDVTLQDIQTLRAIVGWCPIAKSRLGCASINYSNIDYSKTGEADGTGVQCSGGSIGFQQFGLAAIDFRIGPKPGRCHYQRKGTFSKVVRVAEQTPVTLYDTGEKRAWLVPASGVILHIIQHRHHLDPFFVDGSLIEIDTQIRQGSTASNILLSNHSQRLSDDEGHIFKDEVLDIWAVMEFLLEENVRRYEKASGVSLSAPFRETLCGFEFKAIVQDRSPMRLKQAVIRKTADRWPQLVREIDSLVLFADGFEDIIAPDDRTCVGICRRWLGVPKGQDYLATTVKMLQQLYDEAGNRLSCDFLTSSSKLQWHQGQSMLFESCQNVLDCKCQRLQRLLPVFAHGTLIPPARLIGEGAVIFGRENRETSCQKRVRNAGVSTGLYSQANVPLHISTLGEASNSCHNDRSPASLLVAPSSTKTCTSDNSLSRQTTNTAARTISSNDQPTQDNSEIRVQAVHVPQRFRASIDKALETIRALDNEIYELSCERQRRLQAIGH
ncbi:hypothetical protein FB567DRAFT_610181 [Paraphoma chrysanthemicola]|uniref:Uncharacterized protein n=1 Tax=Paraphoma chrysanthemicola TaxID=798071 RepID=A0A8K0RHW9_9PLEO|nr:hypothetical protein FB567DRAFT_610181 [Paraphoma chrysanthemicola]